MRPIRKVTTILAGLVLLAALSAARAHAAGDWNDSGVNWRPYSEGIAEAKKQKKPVCLIFYTDWCPHCKNYSSVFHDPKVVEESKNFVMIRLNADQEKELAKQYSGDGGYIPRTFFLTPEGKLDTSIHAPRDKYMYFYDEKDPASVLAAMAEAKKKTK
jgi:thiol:disulfide interchange protein